MPAEPQASAAEPFVLYECRDNVATITLNRPERMNAVGIEMGAQLDAAFIRAATDESARVLIVTGAGRGFCAGGDMERLTPLADSRGSSLEAQSPGVPNEKFAVVPGAPPELRTR